MTEQWKLTRIQGNKETEKYKSATLKGLWKLVKLKGLLVPKK